jgi:signal transduction histidine kinase
VKASSRACGTDNLPLERHVPRDQRPAPADLSEDFVRLSSRGTRSVTVQALPPGGDAPEVMLAVLAHDLRTPLAAITFGAELLLRSPGFAERSAVPSMIKRSAAHMRELINSLVALSRGGLEEGLQLVRREGAELEEALRVVIEEHRAAWPEKTLVCKLALPAPIECDVPRLVQLACNLLSNALTHGMGESVSLCATGDGKEFELTVVNSGGPITVENIDRTLAPAEHGRMETRRRRGLGLYIACQVARAHGGKIELTCEHGTVSFAFRMPARIAGPLGRAVVTNGESGG